MTVIVKEKYTKKSRQKRLIIGVTLIIVFCTFILDLLTGPAMLSLSTVIQTIGMSDTINSYEKTIIWDIRLPVAIAALLVGSSLAIAGAEMQTILNNPLASPYTLGLSSAAGFGAAIVIVLGKSFASLPYKYMVPIGAFLFAILGSFILYSISKHKKSTSDTLILAGIALSFLFSALQGVIQFLASAEQNQAVVFWLFGSLYKVDFISLTIIFLVLIACIPFLYRNIWKLTALRLGDESAQSLGINVKRMRIEILILVSILTATAVSFVGTIGFVGLVSPHVARILVGEDQRYFLPYTAIIGALILSGTSIVSKLILPNIIFPIGILTSLLGVPFFLWIIFSSRRSFW
nr:iron ABC transporter permease [uncultured Methanospirillum sp.]